MYDILLVEDNEDIQIVNKKMLDKQGIYNVRLAMDLAEARKEISEAPADIIVLDIMLPDGNGLDFLSELRQEMNIDVPVLLLTALGTSEDVVEGLSAGGDDYLPKPYDYDIFVARIEALLRRSGRIPETITKGALTIKLTSNEMYINNERRRLSQNEFSLLLFFVQNENRLVSAEHIYEQVWGQKMAGDNSAIKNAIYKLRKKLAGSGFTISPEWNKGYCFERG